MECTGVGGRRGYRVSVMSPRGPARRLAQCSDMSGVGGQSGLEIDGFIRSKLTHLYGPAVCCKPDVTNGDVWSCASVSGP